LRERERERDLFGFDQSHEYSAVATESTDVRRQATESRMGGREREVGEGIRVWKWQRVGWERAKSEKVDRKGRKRERKRHTDRQTGRQAEEREKDRGH
jgi:hypothetical protein